MARSEFSNQLKISVICGDHDRSQTICKTLADLQLDAHSGEFSNMVDIFLIDLTTCRPALVEEVIQYTCESRFSSSLIVTLGKFPCGAETPKRADVRLSSDNALKLARSRFHFAHRTAARRAEIELRRESYKRYGCNCNTQAEDKNYDVLYVGEASTRFMSLKNHLETLGVNIIAAFSAYTAFDYLHDHKFAAVLLDVSATSIRPDNFCAMVQRSSNLAEMPILALGKSDYIPSEHIIESAADIIDDNSSLEAISDQLLELTSNQAPSAKEFLAPQSSITDAETGLFTRNFFEDHLDRQIEWSLDFNQPLTVLIIDVLGSDDKADIRDLAYTASVVRTLLRVQDAPTRLNDSTLAISMPGSTKQTASYAARRIEGVLDATAFESELNQPARQVTISWKVTELNPEQSANQLLSDALSNTQNDKGHAAA